VFCEEFGPGEAAADASARHDLAVVVAWRKAMERPFELNEVVVAHSTVSR